MSLVLLWIVQAQEEHIRMEAELRKSLEARSRWKETLDKAQQKVSIVPSHC